SGYAAGVTVDSSGNAYVTGQNSNNNGFYVTKFNSTGTVVYNTTVGSGPNVWPYGIALDSTGKAYVTGQIYSGSTLPTSSNAYQSTVTGSYNAFLAVISADGSTVPYATYLGGSDSSQSAGLSVAVDSSQNAYISGWTESATFPTTSGAYQTAFSPSQDGIVVKINPLASTGPTSLVYSTLLGPGNSYLIGIAVDSSGDAYVTGFGAAGFPVTAGAFRYSGVDSTSGGVYVTKLNSTASALVYSAYLGYGTGYGIAVEGQSNPSAYVTGEVNYADFPTTSGAYQTSYAGGFATKLSSDGSTETYSTFLGGPSSYTGGTAVLPTSIALPNGCSSSCNAYIAGYTNTADFPAINPIQSTPSNTGNSGFIVELAADGGSALFSSYLSGYNSGVYNQQDSQSFGITPSIGVDSSGNMSVVGDIYSTSDFPITISTANPTYAFLAKIGPATTPFTIALPSTINFGNQAVGVSTSISNGTATVRLRNMSATAATLQSITTSASIFSESDNCGGSIPAGGFCTLSLNFTPAAPGARTGTVTVTSNASDSPTTITVNGTGVDAPYITASPTSLVFGDQATGTSSAQQSVTLTNIGDETAALSVYTNTVNFSELNNCPSQLAPGSSCLVNVTFSPTQPGLATDNLYFYSPSFGTGSIPLSGSGTVTGANSAISLSATSLSFGNQVVNTTSPIQQIFVTNNGSVPIVIQSITTSVTSGSGNFTISYNACGNPTGSLSPQANCQLQVTFTPTAAGTVTGTLTINDSATGSPQTVSLTGTGVAATETLEFYPGTAIAFPDTPVGVTSGSQIVYAQNTGTAPITMDRVVVSGDFHISSTTCEATTLPGTLNDGASGSYSYCYAYVVFTPTATGARTGTLTFIDSASTSPQVVNLSGNGITASGTLALDPTQLDFPSQAIGTTSAASSSEAVYLSNPGNTPITINNWSATGDFTVTNWYCSTPPFTLNPGGSCGIYIQFTPSASGTRTGTLTVNSTAGNQTAALNGTGVTATQTIQITPTSMTFGSVVVGQTASQYPLYIQNTGTEPVSLTTLGALSGTNAGDFTVNTYTCPVGGNLQPGTSCEMLVSFTPGGTGSRTASLQNVDSAGTQNVPLSGTGVSATPTYTTSYAELVYNSQVQGTTSPTNTYTYFYNNGTLPVTLGTATVTSGFVKPSGDDTCSGSTITGGGNCYVYVSFAPTTPGYTTGTLTFKNSSNTTLATVALAGYSPAAANSAYLDPTGLNFTNQVVTTTSNYQTLTLYNSGNLPFTVGTLNGTNVGTPPTDEFSISSGNGGGDNCSGQTVQPGSSCSAYVTFTPSATGTRTGSLSFPVTYADSTTATFTATLAGTGVAETNSAVVSPTAASFVDQTVGATTPYTVQLNLTNSGNQPFTVGTLSGTNTIVGSSGTGEFSTSSANGGSDNCSHVTLQPGSTCIVYVTFTPSATGTQTGSITFPVTFKDGTTANPTATLSGNGVAANKGLQISPLSLQFPVQVVSTTSSAQGITVKNLGNTPVHFGTDSVTGDFAISYDSCVGTNLAYNQTCQINVTFTPSTTGNRTGTLTIADNGTGGPHAVSLSGTGIPANQQITLSQTTVAFGNQPAGSTSSQMAVYITNQSDSTVTGFTIALGGTNPSDFTLNTNNCPTGGGNLGARATCAILVAFAPVTGTSGALSATVTVTDSDSGSPRTITLTGTSVTAGPAVAFTPGSGLTFASQSVGTTSPAQTFSVTNTGTANLTITAVTSTDATEFPIYSDGCTGATLLPHQQCTVSVRFSPSTGGARSSTIKVTDNATGSPQSLPVSGTGVGIPVAGVSPSSLTFSSQGTGTRSASQPVTISNTGTGPLTISNIDISGGNPADFAQTNTCGTLPATVAVGATCTVNVTFA
ncbi:MAG: choice-of-anchor D domain-containing protein, partial [Acidobacteriaceae bacterium]|nr:choice-of-anchor D domain-containing protein [Acidobacteriaceae bacterium]